MSAPEFYLVKRGLFYRPDAKGYTASIAEAGKFSRELAELEVSATAGALDPAERVQMSAVTPPSGVDLIAAERARQPDQEGFNAEHDDNYTRGQLVDAALSYIHGAINVGHPSNATAPEAWPWDGCWWKPSPDPVRNLVKAGALIAAEIDRLQRAAQRKGRG